MTDEHNGGPARLPLVAAALVVPTVLAGLALLWPGPPAGTAAARADTAAAAVPTRTPTTPTTPTTTVPVAPTTTAPAAPEVPATELDEAGKARLRAVLGEALTAAPLTFLPDSAELTPEGAASLGAVVELVRAAPTARLQVDGFVATGPTDGELSAQQLSDARAVAVAGALVAGGVPADRVTARGLGEGGTPQVGPAGRRVEITVV